MGISHPFPAQAYVSQKSGAARDWCDDNGLDAVALDRAKKLFGVLRRAVAAAGVFRRPPSDAEKKRSADDVGDDDDGGDVALDDLAPATAAMDAVLAKGLCASSLDRVARKAAPALVEARHRAAAERRGEAWDPRSLSAERRDCAYELLCESRASSELLGETRLAYVSATSALASRSCRDLPEFLVYATVGLRAGKG